MRNKILLCILLSISGVILFPTFCSAAHWNIQRILCLGDIYFLEFEELPIPVGCEVVDCCPGCPGPDPIDWRIRIRGDLIDSVQLDFKNVGYDVIQRLKFKGGIKQLGSNSVLVADQDAYISGFERSVRQRPTVAIPKFNLNQAGIKKIMDARKAFDKQEITVSIDQMIGSVVVNRFRLHYWINFCREFEPTLREDKVDIDSNTANDRAIVMLTGRRSPGCIDNDREFQNTTDQLSIGNMLSNDGCTEESVVFSDDNAMAIDTMPGWTDARGDLWTIPLAPILTMPVNIVLARAGANLAATNDITNADFLYNDNNAGTGFNWTIQDVSGNAAAVNTITRNDRCTPANLADLQGSAFYNANTLNVYYVTGAFTAGNCINDRLVVFVGNNANAASLAHEFGHSFSLFGDATTGGHTNGLAGFGTDNIMNGGGPATRDHFSVGQVFRFNINNASTLNTTGVRTDTTRNCPALTTNDLCPRLSLDSLPH